ncbi:hypothetical protein RTH46_11525 [Pseudomonas sp. zfem004]|uniref:hypothetical protein n=1 Tax=Pseudomonas sp. zfem004 TaxID=3078199 RepID=UPI002927BB9F|nr:hypothetical protein [Pseudomonas sp. zfem004]MDU9403118.1 hypothetical protein [Pseudomonas sp. zfem004]
MKAIEQSCRQRPIPDLQVANSNTRRQPSKPFFRVRENLTAFWLPIWPTHTLIAPYQSAHNVYYVKLCISIVVTQLLSAHCSMIFVQPDARFHNVKVR